MNEEFLFRQCRESMQGAIKHLENELLNIRAGKANPVMLKSVMVDYYGAATLEPGGQCKHPDGRTSAFNLGKKPCWQRSKRNHGCELGL